MASIQVNAEKLRQACENFIEYREARIVRERDELVLSYVGLKKYRWFGKPMNYDEAKAQVLKEDKEHLFGWEWSIIGNRGRQQAESAKQFLALTKHGDPVTLTDEDIWIMEYV